MPHGLIIYLLLIAFGSVIALSVWWHGKTRRQRVRQKTFPSAWEQILQRNLAIYRHLPPDLKRELLGDIQVFLDEKIFEGCSGLEITDEMRVTIAAEACLLLLNRPTKFYPNLVTILVYPHFYTATVRKQEGAVVVENEQTHLGESWQLGAVVLAWDAVRVGAADAQNGRNVALHEFAHQLDGEDGRIDGTPLIRDGARFRTWTQVLNKEFVQLQARVGAFQESVIDAYGATSPAEFFAVATETFFEKPQELLAKEPELYRVLADFFQLDPASWLPPACVGPQITAD